MVPQSFKHKGPICNYKLIMIHSLIHYCDFCLFDGLPIPLKKDHYKNTF